MKSNLFWEIFWTKLCFKKKLFKRVSICVCPVQLQKLILDVKLRKEKEKKICSKLFGKYKFFGYEQSFFKKKNVCREIPEFNLKNFKISKSNNFIFFNSKLFIKSQK